MPRPSSLLRIWYIVLALVGTAWGGSTPGRAAVVEAVGEPGRVVGAAAHGGTIYVATENAVRRRAADGKFSAAWMAPRAGSISAGPLVVGDRIYLIVSNQLVASPAAETLQFSPVAVGAAAWELPRQVHDRWVVQTEAGVRQSRDLQKWEPLFPPDGIEAKHLVWHDNAWWALANPPPAKQDSTAVTVEGDLEADDWRPGGGGMLAAARATMQLRRSADLKQWTTVREVDVSLVATGLYSFAGRLVHVGEAGLDLIPTDPAQEMTTAEASEGLRWAAVMGGRMWVATEHGLLVSGENDPGTWTWMNGDEFSREITAPLTALPAFGRMFALGTAAGQVVLLRPADQERIAAGGLAFAPPAVPAGLLAQSLPPQTKQVVAAGGKYLAITWAKNGLWAAEPGGPWRNVAAFGKQVNAIATLGDRALAVVDYTGVLLWDAATGRSLPVEPPPVKSFSTVHAVNGRFFGIGSAGHLAELGADGRWQLITLPSDDPNFGVVSITHHDGHFLVAPVRQAGLYRTADFQNWTYAPMKGGNTRLGRLFNTGRRLLAVQHYGSQDKDATPVELAVSIDGVTWQEIEGLVAARDSYFRGALHDGRRHVLVFTRELWVSEGDDAQAWRRVPAEQNAFFELTNDRLAVAQADGLYVRDVGELPLTEPAATRVARVLASAPSWQAAGPAAVAERKKQEALAKAAAEAIPPTVAGAVEMAKAFHHFEQLYVSGASRKGLAQQVVGVYEAVRKHRPQLADEVAEVLSVLVVNLEVRDALTTAFLAHHLPGFRKKVQARYGKAYSQIYWSLKRAPGAQPVNEYEVDVMKELLMSHTDNSYMRRVTFPKIPQGYPNYDADKPRTPVEFAAVPDAPFDTAQMLKNLIEKGWAGAALDRDVMHANKLQIEAATPMRHVWLLAARALWPGTPPASSDDLLKRSKEEKARLGSLFATDGLALDARKAGRTEDFARYRDLAVERGMQASRYVSYADQMAAALSVMNQADQNMAAAMGDYANQVSAAAAGGTDPVSRLVNQFPAGKGGAASARRAFELITPGEIIIRDMELDEARAKPEGPARKQALDDHDRKWDEKLRFRQLAQKLFEAAALTDTEENGMARAAALLGISRTDAALFSQTPQHPGNRLLLPSLLGVAQNRIPREQHAEVLDRILRDVPMLADVWVLRAGYHIEAGEWDLADGSLAVARMLNPKEPSLEKMETRLDAQRPALTNADIIRQRFARTWEEAEASVDDELRSRDPAADYALGLEFEQGTKGQNVKERIDRASFHYLKAALADHVPSMLGYVRVANANLQQPGLSETSRAAIEKGIIQWVNKAADLGNGEALRVRAGWRANGQAGLTADRGLAWLELERAAEAGDWLAMRMLAQAAHAGEWGRQNFKTVENWLERARAAGDPEAGRMLEELRKQQQGGKK
jgi:hypothetical protein